MKILDLTNPEKSFIKYKVSKFPDGQQTIDLETLHINDEVKILSRLNNFSDLELIICATKALRELEVERIHLYTPYFLGARSDRKFQEGGVNYLKDVICPIINLQNFTSVTITDAHSDVIEACINNYKKIDNINIVEFALTDIGANELAGKENLYIVSPDSGALKKIYHVAEHFKLDKIVIANKHRDTITGRVTHTEVNGLPEVNDINKFVIIDDICDGGRTFIEIAKEIRKQGHENSKIYLVVTHGLFSKGFSEIRNYIDGVYSTNSIGDLDSIYLKQLNIF